MQDSWSNSSMMLHSSGPVTLSTLIEVCGLKKSDREKVEMWLLTLTERTVDSIVDERIDVFI